MRFFMGTVAVIVVGVGLCSAESKSVKRTVPLHRPGLGVGGGSSAGLFVAEQDDRRVNTCAIVEAVNALPAGFIELPSSGLDPKRPYGTDYQRVDSSLLSAYNQSSVGLDLTAGPLYGVKYEISYEVDRGFIVLKVKSVLYYAGRDSLSWYEYRKKYNDTFFSQRLLNEVEQRLKECAKSK